MERFCVKLAGTIPEFLFWDWHYSPEEAILKGDRCLQFINKAGASVTVITSNVIWIRHDTPEEADIRKESQ